MLSIAQTHTDRYGSNLMAKDEFKNLGFANDAPEDPKKSGEGKEEKGKNELLW